MLQFTPPFRNFVPKIRYTYNLTYRNAQFTLAFLLQTLTIYKTLTINPQFNALNIIHHLAIYKSSINPHPILLSYPSPTSHLNFKSLALKSIITDNNILLNSNGLLNHIYTTLKFIINSNHPNLIHKSLVITYH